MLQLASMFRLDRLRVHNDRGQVMLAVVGLIAVTVIITATIAVTTVRALGFTTMTRAGVEAQAAAESGVDAMIIELNQGRCVAGQPFERSYGDVDPSLPSELSANQFFSVTVQTRAASNQSWQAACPTGSTEQVKISSTGFALHGGIAGSASARDAAAVEAVYDWTVAQGPSDPIPASGASLYSFGSPGSNYALQHFTLNPSPDGLPPTLQLKQGNFVCNGTTVINGNLEIESGSVSLQNSACRVNGDVRVGGGFNSTSGARISGSLYASGMWNSTYSANISNASNVIEGDLVAAGPVSARGTIGGNLIAGPRTGNSLFFDDVRVGGTVTVAGGIRADGGLCRKGCTTDQSVAVELKVLPHVQGQVRYGQSGMQAPIPPSVPGWVDFNYDRNDWVTTTGTPFNEVVLSSSECSWTFAGSTGLQKLKTALASGQPTIINALACSNGISWYQSINPSLTSDLVIVANKFEVGDTGRWASADGQTKRVWLITPDRSADLKPTCTTPAGNSTFNSGTRMTSTVAAMFYSPCDLANNAVEWRGQMYARNAFVNGGLVLTYTPVGLPGVDLSTGSSDPGAGGGTGGDGESSVGSLVSFRDVPVPGR